MLLALSLVIAACGKTDSAKLNAFTGGDAEADGPNMIRFAITKSSRNAAFVSDALFAEFERQTGIRVNLQYLPTEQITAVLQTKLAVGETPDLILYNLMTAVYELNLEKNFAILDAEPWAARVLNRSALSYNGHIYGFHVNQDAGQQGIVYNKAVFRELGIDIPGNYEQLLAVCERLREAGYTPFFMPFKDSWATNLWLSSAIADYAKKGDPALWDDLNGGKRRFADVPAFASITEQQRQLFLLGYTNPNILDDSYDMATDVFIKREAVMMTMGDWFIADVLKHAPEMELGLFPVPYADGADLAISPLGGQLFIPKKAKHLNEAKRFLEFLAEKEQAQRIVNQSLYVSNLQEVSTPKLPPYKQEIVERYIEPGRTVMTMETNLTVDPSGIWRHQQEMFAGGLSAEDVWTMWDEKFAELRQEKYRPLGGNEEAAP